MPYIERDFGGKLIGVYTNPQHNRDGSLRTEPDPVPDDHPELVEFMGHMPKLTQAHMTAEDFKREKEDQEKVDREIPQIQQLALQHIQAWAQVETALSALLHTVINGQKSHIAYAIYYGLNGFDGRLTIVSNGVIQLINETKELEVLRDDWTAIAAKLISARDNRNTFAHGTIQILIYNKRKEARISPLPFDIVRLGWEIKKKGRPKGFDLNEFARVVKREWILAECLDAVNTIISQHRQFGPATFPKTTPELADRLTALSSP